FLSTHRTCAITGIGTGSSAVMISHRRGEETSTLRFVTTPSPEALMFWAFARKIAPARFCVPNCRSSFTLNSNVTGKRRCLRLSRACLRGMKIPFSRKTTWFPKESVHPTRRIIDSGSINPSRTVPVLVAGFENPSDNTRAGGYAHLDHDKPQESFYSVWADLHSCCDLPAREALHQILKHLPFPSAQTVPPSYERSVNRCGGRPFNQKSKVGTAFGVLHFRADGK